MQGSPHAIFIKTRNVPCVPTAFQRGTVGSVATEGPEESGVEKVDIGPKARSRLSRQSKLLEFFFSNSPKVGNVLRWKF